MQPHYIEFNGKHPKATKENRVYTDKPDNRWSSYGCSYSDEFLKLDIDDYDHKTGVPEEPIHNKPRNMNKRPKDGHFQKNTFKGFGITPSKTQIFSLF